MRQEAQLLFVLQHWFSRAWRKTNKQKKTADKVQHLAHPSRAGPAGGRKTSPAREQWHISSPGEYPKEGPSLLVPTEHGSKHWNQHLVPILTGLLTYLFQSCWCNTKWREFQGDLLCAMQNVWFLSCSSPKLASFDECRCVVSVKCFCAPQQTLCNGETFFIFPVKSSHQRTKQTQSGGWFSELPSFPKNHSKINQRPRRGMMNLEVYWFYFMGYQSRYFHVNIFTTNSHSNLTQLLFCNSMKDPLLSRTRHWSNG